MRRFGLRFSVFGYRKQGAVLQVDMMRRTPSTGCRLPDAVHRSPTTDHRTPYTVHRNVISGNNRGQALVIVLTILAMMIVVGVAFFMLTQAERVSSIRFLESIRARYVAEAGVIFGQGLLAIDRATTFIDSLDELPGQACFGTEADVDADGLPEGRWFSVLDSSGATVGRFALSIVDEASKINIDTCAESVLASLFSAIGIDAGKASSVSGARPFNAVEEVSTSLGKEALRRAHKYLTLYSREREVDIERRRRTYLTSGSAQLILEALRAGGVSGAAQKACNIKDASDSDVAQTFLDTFVLGVLPPSSLSEPGGWVNAVSHYEAQAGSASGTFSWSNLSIADGEYHCYLWAPTSSDVVGVVNGQRIASGDSLRQDVTVTGASFSLNIAPDRDLLSRLSHVELESLREQPGLTRKVTVGSEAIAINELMVSLTQEIATEPATINTGELITRTVSGIPSGTYYLAVLAQVAGGLVGDVTIHGVTSEGMRDAEFFSATVSVAGNGELTLQIKNNAFTPASFRGVRICQQPDAEFIELVNCSPTAIEVSGFSVEAYATDGELVPGWPARIPAGTSISSYQHLILAVDAADAAPAPQKLRSNNISFQQRWGFAGVGLDFGAASSGINRGFDLLPDGGGQVILRDASGRQVDAVEYLAMQVRPFVSIERTDPAAHVDSDGDGLSDGWYASEATRGATPAQANDNIGMITVTDTGEEIRHSISESMVFNRALSGLQEVLQLSSGGRWQHFTIADVSKMVDRFAYRALEFPLAGHDQSGEFKETNGLFRSEAVGDRGIWQFTGVAPGSYFLSLQASDECAEGHSVTVSYRCCDEEIFQPPATLLAQQGKFWFGSVVVPGERPCDFFIEVTNTSAGAVALTSITLEPINETRGRVNVNTALLPVLRSLLGNEHLTQAIIAHRPFGASENLRLGVGELLLLDPAFLSFHDNLTVKSDTFAITSRGESFRQDKSSAFHIIRTVVSRGE